MTDARRANLARRDLQAFGASAGKPLTRRSIPAAAHGPSENAMARVALS